LRVRQNTGAIKARQFSSQRYQTDAHTLRRNEC
jgi:hypothetical protein